jgi:5-methylcytosine-specific restriction endonuclease McrA
MGARRKITASLRENVWILQNGRRFESKCAVTWCNTIVDVFNFECGHNIAYANGGATDISNLLPICGKCNKSMGTMTITEFSKQVVRPPEKVSLWENFRFCIPSSTDSS